jgi:hypothetical protein
MLSPSFPGCTERGGDPHQSSSLRRAARFLLVSVVTQKRAMIGLPGSSQDGVSAKRSPGSAEGEGPEEAD